MKYRKVSEFEITCWACASKLRLQGDEIRFSSNDDQRVICPVCQKGVTVLRNGSPVPNLLPVVYGKSWESADAQQIRD